MVKNLILFSWIFCILLFILPKPVNGSFDVCSSRYLTLINPVRGRNLWKDQSLKPIKDQYKIIKDNNFPATWLLQYDTLKDKELIGEIKSFNNQEKGVFLEVSEDFSEKARVIYQYDTPWYSPGAVFLSGYTQSERVRLIDTLFNDFKKEFGFYPKSVGAWWIDSYSLKYLNQKYDIKAALIVADQKTTDNYGVWGQWWGVPYYPSKADVLTPASSLANKQDVVILQWAQRHPVLAVGEGYKSSYSLQANDYTLLEKDTDFFKELINVYLDCKNPVGQITVGIETGMESINFIGEYQKQLDYLKTREDIKAVTMEEFAKVFSGIHQDYPKSASITYEDSTWNMNTQTRTNDKFKETIIYDQNKAFSDYFLPDKSKFLNRNLTNEPTKHYSEWNNLLLVGVLLSSLLYLRKKLFWLWISSALFLFVSFGLLLKSFYLYGHKVYFGPVINNLMFAKISVTAITLIIFWLIWKKFHSKFGHMLLLTPLSFAFDPILNSLRASFISEKFYLGFATDVLHFVGVTFERPFILSFVNQDFPSYLAAGLLKFDFNKIWDNLFYSLFIYPVLHMVLGLLIVTLLKKLPFKLRVLLIIILSLLLFIHLKNILESDPRAVTFNR